MRRRVETERVTTEADRPGVELVALVASAGGLEALTTVLRDLPRDFPAAVVVQQ
ncbi:chemotaxis protein CheB, partial [Mycobacterium avium]